MTKTVSSLPLKTLKEGWGGISSCRGNHLKKGRMSVTYWLE
jgi:hypothetical protein